ncbi:hypothetical protein MTO96_030199 [Rhipicephalus appendiculatus]
MRGMPRALRVLQRLRFPHSSMPNGSRRIPEWDAQSRGLAECGDPGITAPAATTTRRPSASVGGLSVAAKKRRFCLWRRWRETHEEKRLGLDIVL